MLPADRWLVVVRDAPLVSIDLVIRDPQGRVLTGWRNNEPARDSWFVPGGAIHKGETLDQAYGRITEAELGRRMSRSEARLLGVYEHHYTSNFAHAEGFGTHYVVLAHAVQLDGELKPGDAQHARFRWFELANALEDPEVHPYSRAYLV